MKAPRIGSSPSHLFLFHRPTDWESGVWRKPDVEKQKVWSKIRKTENGDTSVTRARDPICDPIPRPLCFCLLRIRTDDLFLEVEGSRDGRQWDSREWVTVGDVGNRQDGELTRQY